MRDENVRMRVERMRGERREARRREGEGGDRRS